MYTNQDFIMDKSKIKALLIISSGCTVAGFFWGLMYYFLGFKLATILPFGFTFFVGSALILYRYFNKLKLLLYTQLFMILIIPTILQWTLGGFHYAGIVILWGIMAPFGSLIFQPAKHSVFWIVFYLMAIFLSLYFDTTFISWVEIIPSGAIIRFFYGMNIIAVSIVTFIAIYYYNYTLSLEKEKRDNYLNELNSNVDIILENIEELARGNLTRQINKIPTDPIIQRLFNGYNNSIELLRNIILEITTNAENVSISIQKISETLEAIEQEVKKHSKAASDIEKYFNKIQDSIHIIHEEIRESYKLSNKNKTLSSDGGEVLKNTADKMENLNSSIQTTTKLIKNLHKSTKAIDDIILSINDIADSTNLLALNASIEAARAGNEGKGFSVVAKEIGNLTSNTTQATKKITEKIKEIKTGMAQANDNFSITLKLAREGKEYAGEIRTVNEEILGISNKLSQKISKLDKESYEQHSNSENVSKHTIEVLDSLKIFMVNIHNLYESSRELDSNMKNLLESTKQLRI